MTTRHQLGTVTVAVPGPTRYHVDPLHLPPLQQEVVVVVVVVAVRVDRHLDWREAQVSQGRFRVPRNSLRNRGWTRRSRTITNRSTSTAQARRRVRRWVTDTVMGTVTGVVTVRVGLRVRGEVHSFHRVMHPLDIGEHQETIDTLHQSIGLKADWSFLVLTTTSIDFSLGHTGRTRLPIRRIHP